MSSLNKSITVLLIMLFSSLLLCACGPTVKDQKLHYGLGTGWYHAEKSSEEMLKDFDECQSMARENGPSEYNPLITQDCLRSKGYILQ